MHSIWNLVISLDHDLVIRLNELAHRTFVLDDVMYRLATNDLLKGGVFITVFWWAWFSGSPQDSPSERRRIREILVYSLLICVPAVLGARLLAVLLPFRLRPIVNPALHLLSAPSFDPAQVVAWSSFPSDHAVLFFALATGFYLVSHRLGWFMYFYAAVFIMFPRLYLGIHYPSDILAGALIGILAVLSIRIHWSRHLLSEQALRLAEYSPGVFYALMFQLCYQTAALYNPFQGVVHAMIVYARGFIHHSV